MRELRRGDQVLLHSRSMWPVPTWLTITRVFPGAFYVECLGLDLQAFPHQVRARVRRLTPRSS